MRMIMMSILIIGTFEASQSWAQISTGSLQGTVVDSANSPIPGATVIVTENSTGLMRGNSTSINGTYDVQALPPGIYDVSVSSVGYVKSVRTNVRITIGQTTRLNFELFSSAVKMRGVEVTASRIAPVELSQAAVSMPIRQEQIHDLPLNSRNFISLAGLAPGFQLRPGGVPSFGAFNQYRFINVYVDGADWKNHINGNTMGNVQGGVVPQDAIQEFRVLTDNYSAEYGRGGAYIVSAVTKRGTNNLHGDAFYYLRNEALDSRGPFEKIKPDFRRYQTGLSLSGPIMKDKLFFAGTYERTGTTTFIQTTPYEPSYNPNQWNQYLGLGASPWTDNLWDLRVTGQPSSNHLVDVIWQGRYSVGSRFWGGLRPKQGGINSHQYVDNVLLKDTWTLSGSSLNELTLQYIGWRVYSELNSTLPELQYPGIILGGRIDSYPEHVKEDGFHLMDNFTYMKDNWLGNHVFKAGVRLGIHNVNFWQPIYQEPLFKFKTDTSTVPYQALISVGTTDPNGTSNAGSVSNSSSLGLFIQDTWNPTSRLTLNLGVRWDAEFNALNNHFFNPLANDTTITNNVPSNYINRADRKNDLSDIGPRLGFSWDIFGTGRTTLRGGFGIFYDEVAYAYASAEQTSVRWITYTINNPGTMDPAQLRNLALSGKGAAQPNVDLMDINIKNPMVREFSLGVSQYISNDLSLGIDYVNNLGTRYYSDYILNYYQPSTKSRTITNKFGNIYLWGNFGSNFYQGILLNITKPYSDGWMLQFSYALSEARSTVDVPSSGYTFLSSFTWAPAISDELHNFSMNFILDLPLQFQLSGIASLGSPTPVAVIIGEDLNNDNNYSDDWPNGQRNSGRPSLSRIRNWFKNVNLQLTKMFPVAGTLVKLELDAFNAFNWFDASAYGARMYDAQGNPYLNFMQPTAAYPAREIQVGARVQF